MKFKITYIDYFNRENELISEFDSKEDADNHLQQYHGWGNIVIKEIIELKIPMIVWTDEDFVKEGLTANGDKIKIVLYSQTLMWHVYMNTIEVGEYYTKEIATDQAELNLSEEVK